MEESLYARNVGSGAGKEDVVPVYMWATDEHYISNISANRGHGIAAAEPVMVTS